MCKPVRAWIVPRRKILPCNWILGICFSLILAASGFVIGERCLKEIDEVFEFPLAYRLDPSPVLPDQLPVLGHP